MNIITLINTFLKNINDFLTISNPTFYELENNIERASIDLNLNFVKNLLEYWDLDYKNSKERKEKYYVQETFSRTLITSLGLLTFNKTYYRSKKKNKNNKYDYYCYLDDYLNIAKWSKITVRAEVKLINNALDNGMSLASNNTIPNYQISRQTISKKIKSINYNENIYKRETPTTLYIEANEVHANLQNKKNEIKNKNKIVPVILTHEGHLEDFVKKKKLKNTHYIASSILKTDKLWEETYKYLNNTYDLDKVETIFLSSDGGTWIKGYDIAFPNVIYVLDKFHYRKALNYIFKRDTLITNIADEYLRNNMINEFKQLVELQYTLFPEQKKDMLIKQIYLLNNIQGIINQHHPKYRCPCSMEGHISNKYAKYITSRPHSYSVDGLKNIVQLLTMKANNIKLAEEIYHQFKTDESTYKKLNLEKFTTNFRLQANEIINYYNKYDFQTSIDNSHFNLQDNYRLDYFLSKRK